MATNLFRNLYRLISLPATVARIESEFDAWRSQSEISTQLFDDYQLARKTPQYLAAFEKSEPLVTICIATYNRSAMLLERSLASVLNQDYKNIEVIVVGDCCTDDTAARMANIDDPRVTFINLAQRGEYPVRPEWRWFVAGTVPINHALRLARGDFITHLDDDDRYAPDRIRQLVHFSQRKRADLVYHPFWTETEPNKWRLNEAEQLSHGNVTTSAIFYHRWLACIPWNINAYKTREPGDFNRIRKLKHLGIIACRYSEPLLWHYRERNQATR